MKSDFFVKLIVTGLGCGYIPVISGTTGSLFGLLIFYLVKDNFLFYLTLSILILILGFIFVPRAEKIFAKKDDRKVVIDEIFGILLSFWGLAVKDLKFIITGFSIFRLLDITKPPPARRLEKLPGAGGVMLDDLVAALYTNLILRLILKF